MMKNRFPLSIMLILGLCWTHGRIEASQRYILRSRTVKTLYYGNKDWDVWLWDKKLSRVVWRRRMDAFDEKESVHWSKDRRALAVECGISNKLRVLVWREGYRLRDFGVPDGKDYAMGCVWSPDNRRLLIRFDGSGAVNVNYGALYCLRLGRWPYYKYSKVGAARKMAWKSRKTVVYWDLAYDGFTVRGPKLWHAP